MTDDIVKLLREQVDDEFLSYRNVLDAADEIERLRKAGDALAHGIRTGQWDDALDAWKAVRGE
jgi:hypothetical protein